MANQKKIITKDHIKVSNQILETIIYAAKELILSDQNLYWHIYRNTIGYNRTSMIYNSQDIRKKLGISAATFSRSKKKLQDLNMIKIGCNKFGIKKIQIIIEPRLWNTEHFEEEEKEGGVSNG